MILRHFLSPFLTVSSTLLFAGTTYAAGPSHSVTAFKHFPDRLFFFDDTPVSIYLDRKAGNVYLSTNEGKSWNRASDIPEGEANSVVEHPFDNNYAFVLSKGKKHWRTADRGKTWHSFDMPLGPASMLKPLSFHSDKKNYGYILYQGTECKLSGWTETCIDTTYYTKDAFSTDAKVLLKNTSRCQFAHSSPDFKHAAHENLIYCVASSPSDDSHELSSRRIFSSTNFFEDKKVEDFGIGEKKARGVVALAIVSKFAVVGLKNQESDEMSFYVSIDASTWAKAKFPHASSAKLHENGYTIVESTKHSLAVDVVLQSSSAMGTLFMSNSNGTYFVESLRDTNRSKWGFVDYESLYGVEGVSLANVVGNAEEVRRGGEKEVRSVGTWDDGSSWVPLKPPSKDANGKSWSCDTSNNKSCSLHLFSVTTPHNFGRVFSSPAPGFVMAVGSVGPHLAPYKDCQTFLSTDAGLTWTAIDPEANKYEFGDSGGILVLVNDEDGIDEVKYSFDEGRSFKSYKLSVRMRAQVLLTVPDSTSQKFMMIGQVARKDQKGDAGEDFALVHLDFMDVRERKCGDEDFERWQAKSGEGGCLMGHKQWYWRRKADADCYVGDKFKDPEKHEENCECGDADYECDYNFVRDGDKCEPMGRESIPAGECAHSDDTYMGSSGWRKIPGNTCKGGKKDEKVSKKCEGAKPNDGEVTHQVFQFPAAIKQYAYFNQSSTILARLDDNSIWQSRNEGYTWTQVAEKDAQTFLMFYHHPTTPDRAYLITNSKRFYYTTDSGKNWWWLDAPSLPNTFGAAILRFHPSSDNLIWVGSVDCEGNGAQCHGEAFYSTDNGAHWRSIEKYVRNCAWARDKHQAHDPTEIICESYQDKKGDQRKFGSGNAMQLVLGKNYYNEKRTVFDSVVGFTKFSEFLIVAQLVDRKTLDLQVSVDGKTFAQGQFPTDMHPETHAYTVLESTTDSIFLHMTMWEDPYYGNILKSNSNGTYFSLSAANVNRNNQGYVDFEKVVGLDGIAIVNTVANPDQAKISGHKELQTRITHNDGGSWKAVNPPAKDSLGEKFECTGTKCGLHIHGYTERFDPRATFSSPSVVGVLMAVGNVGESLARYTDSDTFLSRDAGFTWEEVRKDAHLWEFGDSGSILIMANDERETDHVVYTTDQGLHWKTYKFAEEGKKLRVRSIVTVPMDTSRKFILLGQRPHERKWVAVHLDLSSVLTRHCKLTLEDSSKDDFELWSPSEERSEMCLFGRQTLYHRRLREADCYVGEQSEKLSGKIEKNCACTDVDFECEFNYERNSEGKCVLSAGRTPLANDDTCRNDAEFWYERTAYRKIPFSSCEGGNRPDLGAKHQCPGIAGHSGFFWWIMVLIPISLAALVGYSYYRRGGMSRGNIRLPGDGYRGGGGDGDFLDTLASVPWFLLGIAGIAWEKITSTVESWSASGGGSSFRGRRGYRNVPADADAQILRFEDED